MVICSTSTTTKDRRTWRRKNGWSPPLHILQIFAWFFFVMFAVLYFGVLVPSLPCGIWRIIVCSINAVVFVVHIVIHLISVSLDPADVNVRAKLHKPLPTFDRRKHSHVIENQYCHICEVKVGSKSKHCSACNKCVSEFDHHCKWLNNCVGGRNYRLFLSCITTALLGCLIIFVLSVALITAYFDSKSWLYPSGNLRSSFNASTSHGISPTTYSYPTASPTPAFNNNNTTATNGYVFTVFVPVHHIVWILFVICSAILSLVGIALLGHLLGFHIFLMCQKFSTYDYIVQKRDHEPPSHPDTFQNQQGSKFIRLPFRLLQQIKTKKANQVTPEGRQQDEHIEEIELQKNCRRSSTDGKSLVHPVVIEKDITNEAGGSENTLENYVGNVYIGSPHRRRHYLEPLYIRPKNSSHNQGEADKPQKSSEILSVEPTPKIKSESTSSTDSEVKDSTTELIHGHPYPHDASRRHLRSPSPAPVLSPILESEIAVGSAIVSWKYRSVSEQSLHMLNEDGEEEEEEGEKAMPSPAQVKQNGEADCNLKREESGSLSNLFVSVSGQTEVQESNNNLPPQMGSKLEDDDKVHEVRIIPQGSFNGFTESNVSNENLKSEECDDPFINGELWAYAPRNGCHLPNSMLFRRSSSMQDESADDAQAHLTRCRSEDEIKMTPRVIRFQRRSSEDQNSWLVKDPDSRLAKKLKDCNPKSGISATALFCVEESDDSFTMANMVIGNKRKYGHFTVPNHVVLPCMNSIHPESRKRTRAVGSKPPKAFHA